MIFEQVYKSSKIIDKHCCAPLCAEREQYLRHMLEEGYSHRTLTSAASYMLHAIQILDLHELRVVHKQEIEKRRKSGLSIEVHFEIPATANMAPHDPLSSMSLHGFGSMANWRCHQPLLSTNRRTHSLKPCDLLMASPQRRLAAIRTVPKAS